MAAPAKAEDDGLDISNPDVTTPEEVARFRAFYARVKGGSLPAHEFWLEFRPDVLKRQRARVRHNDAPGEKPQVPARARALKISAHAAARGPGIPAPVTPATAANRFSSSLLI